MRASDGGPLNSAVCAIAVRQASVAPSEGVWAKSDLLLRSTRAAKTRPKLGLNFHYRRDVAMARAKPADTRQHGTYIKRLHSTCYDHKAKNHTGESQVMRASFLPESAHCRPFARQRMFSNMRLRSTAMNHVISGKSHALDRPTSGRVMPPIAENHPHS